MRAAGQDDNQAKMAGQFLRRHGISSIELAWADAIGSAQPVCEVLITFLADEYGAAYRVRFKLPPAQSAIANMLERIGDNGRIDYLQGASGDEANAAMLRQFLATIESRVAKIRHEQAVQRTVFVGNSFELNNRTVFTVLADNGGRLDIELHRNGTRQPTAMLASALLDGLYDGSIRLLEQPKGSCS